MAHSDDKVPWEGFHEFMSSIKMAHNDDKISWEDLGELMSFIHEYKEYNSDGTTMIDFKVYVKYSQSELIEELPALFEQIEGVIAHKNSYHRYCKISCKKSCFFSFVLKLIHQNEYLRSALIYV